MSGREVKEYLSNHHINRLLEVRQVYVHHFFIVLLKQEYPVPWRVQLFKVMSTFTVHVFDSCSFKVRFNREAEEKNMFFLK